jgi:NO-binding membrane sensor protein with MHYT domain
MTAAHNPWLVALSLMVALQGTYVGLHLARQIATEDFDAARLQQPRPSRNIS